MDPRTTQTELKSLEKTPEEYLLKGSNDDFCYETAKDGKIELKGATLSRLVDKLVVSNIQGTY